MIIGPSKAFTATRSCLQIFNNALYRAESGPNPCCPAFDHMHGLAPSCPTSLSSPFPEQMLSSQAHPYSTPQNQDVVFAYFFT